MDPAVELDRAEALFPQPGTEGRQPLEIEIQKIGKGGTGCQGLGLLQRE